MKTATFFLGVGEGGLSHDLPKMVIPFISKALSILFQWFSNDSVPEYLVFQDVKKPTGLKRFQTMKLL